ncbi:plasmid recombination protein [Acinetobacter nosocomialis]|nr:plasmid recombination protein [Acinetobacter nosocomialis]
MHRDETTPHLVAYVVPIDSKGNLNCREFLAG